MDDSEHHDALWFLTVEHAVWKALQKGAPNIVGDGLADSRVVPNQFEKVVDSGEKLDPKANSLQFVPCERVRKEFGCRRSEKNGARPG